MRRADYDYRLVPNNLILLIVDLDLGGMSLTNDIEGVLADIRRRDPSASWLKIYYRDSTGHWDEVREYPQGLAFMPGPNQTAMESLWQNQTPTREAPCRL